MFRLSHALIRYSSGCLLILSHIVSIPMQAQARKELPQHPAAKLIGTEQRQLHSRITNQDYEIYISLPDAFNEEESTYPVIYLTDANTQFGMMADITRNLQWGREMPETIVVGIGYPLTSFKSDDERWSKWLAWRARDLSPTNSAQTDKDFGIDGIKSGGAPAFLQFLEQELMPMVEKEYRGRSTERTIAGFSLGGLFGLYSLFQKPGLFQNYVIGSPSVWYDNKVILEMEKSFANTHKELPARIFMSAGALEEEINAGMVRNMLELNSLLKSRQYTGLTTEAVILEGETHMSAPSVCFQRAMRFLFRK